MAEIVKVEILPVTLQYPSSIKTAWGKWPCTPIIVRLETDDGSVGWGVSNPFPGSYSESQSSMEVILHELIAPNLLGRDPFDIERFVNDMDTYVGRNPLAKAAIDFALYDLLARILKIPVYRLLGGMCRERTPLGHGLSVKSPQENAGEALRIREAGFSYVNIKVGGVENIERDVARVRAVRDSVGSDYPLHVDANQTWTREAAIRAVKKMSRYDVEYVESPVPGWDLDGMKAVRQQTGVLVSADEAAFSPSDVLNVIRAEAADMFAVHVPKPGGILRTKQFIAIAEAANMPVSIGHMVGGWIESAVNAHMCASTHWLGKRAHHCSIVLYLYDILDTTSVTKPTPEGLIGDLPKVEKGYFYTPKSPGLGFQVDEDILRKSITPGKKPLVSANK